MGLIVSGKLQIRNQFGSPTARVAYQETHTYSAPRDAWLRKVYEVLQDMCSLSSLKVQTSTDSRFASLGTISIRSVITTLSYNCLYPLWIFFYSTGFKLITDVNLKDFSLVSVAALIMSVGERSNIMFAIGGQYMGRPYPGYVNGLILNISGNVHESELEAIRARLLELGIKTEYTLKSRRVARAASRIVIPNSELSRVRDLLGHHVIPSLLHLIED